ncbi:PHD finger protein MALE MEIOCYTE DEATH 1 [Coffea eugenioides]|uniref:PHD finger protein MALE MEIOCYTE DEATH 1 n=1 Tax=Coffea eugenioides TaxID=49369 RepID=UPI000F615761|nr:PHD finger protein MALE MEIOCYTE DEATH 1 [Coffea eugenioides]
MSKSNLEAQKMRKGIPKYYGFHTFGDPGYPILLNGPFRDNIRIFLQQCAELQDYKVEGMSIWSTFLVHENGGFVVPLYAIEEHVKHSLSPFCDHCRCAGWSHHFVSRRKYHLIIPVDGKWNKPLGRDAFDLETHLLHGLIHCNGFGHLLCINGIEGGSKKLCGREIMDLWDRICSNLQASKITVEDVSKKHMMDLRLLHGVAYGHPWFGRWGYRFCHGSFGVREHHYERAIELLSSLKLDDVIRDFDFTDRCKEIKEIIHCYRNLSETNLITLRDLFRFMLVLKSRAEMRRNAAKSTAMARLVSSGYFERKAVLKQHFEKEKSAKCRKFSAVAANWDSRWPVRRLEFTANVIVDALREKKAANRFRSSVMNRQEVRDAARQQIGDTGLIDYVLKSLNNVVVGGYIVRRMVNRATRKLEFTIEEVKNGVKFGEGKVPAAVQACHTVPRNDVFGDLSCLYDNILFDYPEVDMVRLAAGTVLNSKYFVKEWPFRDEQDLALRFTCRLMPSLTEMETELTRELPRGEYIVVPLHSTIGDLKIAIQSAMRDTYCIMKHLLVTDIIETEGMSDEEVLFGILESGTELWVRGTGLNLETDLRYEGGADNWKVRCRCGAQDDDGERMVSCDMCEIWQHTRCCGIEDSEAVPPVFVCDACCTSLAPSRAAQPSYELEPYGALVSPAASYVYYPEAALLNFGGSEIFQIESN